MKIINYTQMERLAASPNNRKTIDFEAIPVHKIRIPTYDKVSIGRPRYRKRSVIRLSTETTRLLILTAKGGPASPLPFIPSSPPPLNSSWIRHTRVIRKQHSPALFAKSAVDSPRAAEKDWDSCLFSGNQKNYLPTFPSFLPPSVDGTSPRLKESTRVAAAFRTNTLFAVFKNLNAFLSLYLHLLPLFFLYAL